jgi:hypothetical protein
MRLQPPVTDEAPAHSPRSGGASPPPHAAEGRSRQSGAYRVAASLGWARVVGRCRSRAEAPRLLLTRSGRPRSPFVSFVVPLTEQPLFSNYESPELNESIPPHPTSAVQMAVAGRAINQSDYAYSGAKDSSGGASSPPPKADGRSRSSAAPRRRGQLPVGGNRVPFLSDM